MSTCLFFSERDATREDNNFDDILGDVAKSLANEDEIETLGKKLDIRISEIQNFIATNSRHERITHRGTLHMLREWDQSCRKG